MIYTGGTFDLFHAGHVHFLRKCSFFGNGFVTVALNTDEFIEQFKGKKPVMTYAERYEVLKACRYVNQVIPNFSGADSRPTIELIKPSHIIIGSDWEKKDYYKQMGFDKKWLKERGIELVYVPYTLNISTTEIKERMMK